MNNPATEIPISFVPKPNPFNLSYSSLEDLHSCPKLFELEKLVHASTEPAEANIDFICGHALGVGIQSLLQGLSLESSVWKSYREWAGGYERLDEYLRAKEKGTLKHGLPIDGQNKKKSFWRVVRHIQIFQRKTWPEQLAGWQLLWFEDSTGKKVPATELGFKVILNEHYTYRGYIDAVLYHPGEDVFCVLEIKTDGMQDTPMAKYQNSFQGNSYCLLLERITGRLVTKVYYLVCEFPVQNQQVMKFEKNPLNKLTWLSSLALDIEMLDRYKALKHFPTRGASCFKFYRPCKYLGICELDIGNLGKLAEDGSYLLPKPDDKEFHFTFTLDELLGEHANESAAA